MTGTLYLVATPIGNLEDISYRAVRLLSEAALIACEDTRQTAKLLAHYGIRTAVVSYHEHNERQRTPELLQVLQDGRSLALVSDAGTPLISDPGYRLVQAAIENTILVVSVPGASAVTTALAVSGFPAVPFHFAGFLSPKRTQIRKQINELFTLPPCTVVLYEAPHRLLGTLLTIAEVYGPDHPIAVCRELTKLHEEVVRGSVLTIQSQFASRQSIKGEITIVVGPKREAAVETPDDEALRDEVNALTGVGVPRMDAIKEVARRYGLPKRDVYRITA